MPKLESFFDLPSLRISFLGFAGFVLLLIPLRLIGASPSLASVSEPPFISTGSPVTLNSLTTYEVDFKRGALFGIYEPRVNSKGAVKPSASVAMLAKDYRLKGVIALDEPEAILEDARTQKTVFVQQGDSLGQMTVQLIRQDAVVLESLGQTHEIKMGGGL